LLLFVIVVEPDAFRRLRGIFGVVVALVRRCFALLVGCKVREHLCVGVEARGSGRGKCEWLRRGR